MVEQSDERDALRARLAGMWASVAGGWAQHAEYADARGAQSAQRMLELARWPGDRVLELACGPGGLGLAAAERVGPGGEVVLTDVVEEMTAIAAARASARLAQRRLRAAGPRAHRRARRLLRRRAVPRRPHVRARAGRALVGEIRRVLRPGGRVALAVWGPRERNPWLGLVMDVVSAHTRGAGAAARHSRPVRARRRRRAARPPRRRRAGRRARRRAVGAPAQRLVRRVVERTSALAGPLSAILAGMPDPAMQALRRRARAAVREYETASGGLDLPGVALIASGRRASAPGAPPDRHDLADGRLAVGDARVQRSDAEVEAPDSPCSSSTTSAWKRRPFLSTSTMSPGAMPLELRRGDMGSGGAGRRVVWLMVARS